MGEPEVHDKAVRVGVLVSSCLLFVMVFGVWTVESSSAATAHPALTVRIFLPKTTLGAGASEKGSLVVHNSGASTVNLTTRCMPMFEVVLSNARATQVAAFTAACVNQPLFLGPGVTRLPFTLTTTYTECIPASAVSQNPGNHLPQCSPDTNEAPPLPVGTYAAKMAASELTALPTPTKVAIRLVRKDSSR